MLEMLAQRIGRRRDATRALARVADTRGAALMPTPRPNFPPMSAPKALNPRGLGTESPFEEMLFFRTEYLLTKGGESSSRTTRPGDRLRSGGTAPLTHEKLSEQNPGSGNIRV